MTIIEAIKSGMPFSRKGHNTLYLAKGDLYLAFQIEDILAGDWEVEEEKIEITKSQLETICHKHSINWVDLAKELGFKS